MPLSLLLFLGRAGIRDDCLSVCLSSLAWLNIEIDSRVLRWYYVLWQLLWNCCEIFFRWWFVCEGGIDD